MGFNRARFLALNHMDHPPYSERECGDALKACERLADTAWSRALRGYWQGTADMWRKRLAEARKRAIAVDPVQPTGPCNVMPWGTDEVHCTSCGRTWPSSEQPNCNRGSTNNV